MFKKWVSMRKITIFLGSLLLVVGCTGPQIGIDIKPSFEPTYNMTQSSSLLSCVGDYIDYDQEAQPLDLFIADIPDHTTPVIEAGLLAKNAIMMVTTAIDRLYTPKVAVVGQNGGQQGRHQVQVLGAFTELNRTAESGALSGDVIFPGGWDLSLGKDQSFNHVALDLVLAESNRIVPGTATSVSIQIYGGSGDMDITFDTGDEFAIAGSMGYTAQQGFHSAQRLLVETAVALMMSRYYDIDIRDCLMQSKNEDADKSSYSYDAPVFPSESSEDTEESQSPSLSERYNSTGRAPQSLPLNKSYLSEGNQKYERYKVISPEVQGEETRRRIVVPEEMNVMPETLQHQVRRTVIPQPEPVPSYEVDDSLSAYSTDDVRQPVLLESPRRW